MSLEWKVFWAVIAITSTLFFIAVFAVVLWIIRKHLSIANIAEKRRKFLRKKLSRLLPMMESGQRPRHLDDGSNVVGQRATCFGPNALRNYVSEVTDHFFIFFLFLLPLN